MNSHLQSIIEKCHLANPKLLEPTISSEIYKICPITLQDILLAMGGAYAIDGNGNFLEIAGGDFVEFGNTYDLTKSPYEQSEEVLEFISKNI